MSERLTGVPMEEGRHMSERSERIGSTVSACLMGVPTEEGRP